MKNSDYIKLFLLLSIFSCNSKKENEDVPRLEFIVYDTLTIPVNDYLVKAIDYNKSSDLAIYASTLDFNTLFISNSNGDTVSKFRILGEGPDFAGTAIFNIGFFNDSTIAVQSNTGITFYNIAGKVIKKHLMREPTTKPFGGGINPRIRRSSDSTLIGFIKSSIFAKDITNINRSEIKQEFKPVVEYDLQSREYRQIAGISEISEISKDEIYYPYLETLFDFQSGQMVSITNPELIVDFYDDDFGHKKSIPIKTDKYRAPITFKSVSESNNDNAYMFINGKLKDINIFNESVYVSFSSGVSEKHYAEYKAKEDMPGLFKDHLNYYTVIINNQDKVSREIKMPYGAVGIGFIKSENRIILNTNSSITETKKGSVFFVAKLDYKD